MMCKSRYPFARAIGGDLGKGVLASLACIYRNKDGYDPKLKNKTRVSIILFIYKTIIQNDNDTSDGKKKKRFLYDFTFPFG